MAVIVEGAMAVMVMVGAGVVDTVVEEEAEVEVEDIRAASRQGMVDATLLALRVTVVVMIITLATAVVEEEVGPPLVQGDILLRVITMEGTVSHLEVVAGTLHHLAAVDEEGTMMGTRVDSTMRLHPLFSPTMPMVGRPVGEGEQAEADMEAMGLGAVVAMEGMDQLLLLPSLPMVPLQAGMGATKRLLARAMLPAIPQITGPEVVGEGEGVIRCHS